MPKVPSGQSYQFTVIPRANWGMFTQEKQNINFSECLKKDIFIFNFQPCLASEHIPLVHTSDTILRK